MDQVLYIIQAARTILDELFSAHEQDGQPQELHCQLGYDVPPHINGLPHVLQAVHGSAYNTIRREDGSAVDTGELISFPTYHTKGKRDYPNLKVSRPVKDICTSATHLRIATSSSRIT